LVGLAARVTAALVMVAVAAGGVTLLHLRARAERTDQVPAAMPVAVWRVLPEDGYVVRERFAGRVEPERRTQVAFERDGLVTRVAAHEGDRVAAGAVLARLDDVTLLAERDRLEAEHRRVASNLELARLTTERRDTLRRQGHAAVQSFDEARLEAAALEAELASVAARLRSVAIDLDKSVVRAPFAGIVAARMVDEGAVVETGSAVLDLLEADRPRARIGVAPEVARRLAVGDPFTLQQGGRPLAASLQAVRPDLATDTRTVPVLFTLDSALGIPFGEIVELVVETRIAEPGAWLPLDALAEGEKGLWTVLTVRESGGRRVVGRETVELLHVEGERVYVRGTLAAGAAVIAGGTHRVIPGQAVEVTAEVAPR
jgi:RND family efflux transporter MFP subunit